MHDPNNRHDHSTLTWLASYPFLFPFSFFSPMVGLQWSRVLWNSGLNRGVIIQIRAKIKEYGMSSSRIKNRDPIKKLL
jgi:hypothetical protein